MTLEQLRRVAEGATPGPWYARGISVSPIMDEPECEPPSLRCYEDADYIATFHPAMVLRLIEVVEAAQARQEFAKEFACYPEESLVAPPRHIMWDRLQHLDERLRRAVGGVLGDAT